MPFPLFIVQIGLVLTALWVSVQAFRNSQPRLTLVGLMPLVAALMLFGFGPSQPTAHAASSVPVNHGACAFGDVYQGLSDVLGPPVGPVTDYQGFLVAPMEFGWLQCDTRIEDPHWRTAPSSLGRTALKQEHLEAEARPLLPEGLLTLIATQLARLDTFWLFGGPLTSPIKDGDTCRVYYEKAVFVYQCPSIDYNPDPSEIGREKLGELLWQVSAPPFHPDQWTGMRIFIAAIGNMVGLVTGLASWWGRRMAFE